MLTELTRLSLIYEKQTLQFCFARLEFQRKINVTR